MKFSKYQEYLLSRPFYVLALFGAVISIIMFSLIARHSLMMEQSASLHTAQMAAKSISAFRAFYESEILDKENNGNSGSLPTPAVMAKNFGKFLARNENPVRFKFTPVVPVHSPQYAKLDSFRQAAMASATTNQDQPFFRYVDTKGGEILRYSVPFVISGQLQGIKEICVPVAPMMSMAENGFREIIGFIIIGFIVALSLVAYLMRRDRHVAATFRQLAERESTRSELLKQNQEELKRSEDRFRSTVDLALDCIITIDEQGKLLEFNPAAEACFGYRREDILGKEMAELLVPENLRDAHRNGLKRFLETDRGNVIGTRIEINALRSDGSEFPVELAIEKAMGEDGVIFVAYMRDITVRRQTEFLMEEARVRAEEANRSKAGFLAMMSHEIRTPLNGVLGVLGLLEETKLDEEQRKFISTARESGQTLLEIICDILDFSKMEAGKLAFEESDFDIKTLCESTVELMMPKAMEKRIALVLDIAEDVPARVSGDPGRIRQVILNLMSNAVKFTENGNVRLKVRSLDGGVERVGLKFVVEDNGIGIPEERHHELFSEFTTVDPSYTRKYGGTGLGLAISKKLVHMMGGEIDFRSKTGKGSTFWFRITLDVGDDNVEEQSSVATNVEEIEVDRRLRILLTEDNPTNAMVARAMLTKAGHRVDTAADGLEALTSVLSRPYDVVLMDVSMPQMDGLEAAAAIRNLTSEAAHIPIIAMTAHAMPGDREKVLAAGMDDYLSKPIIKSKLMAAMAYWCGSKDEAKINATAEETIVGNSVTDISADIDTAVLQKLAAETSEEMLPILIKSFLDDSIGRIDRAVAALESGDLEVLEREAHTLCSSAATFGARQLYEVCRTIDEALRVGDEKTALEVAQNLGAIAHAEFDALKAYLTKLAA